MTIQDTHRRLQAMVENRFGKRLGQDDSFAAIGIDSLSMAEFSLAIEKEFNVRMDEGVLDLESVTELAKYIDDLMSKTAAK